MLSPDDYTQPVAPVAHGAARGKTASDIDSKIESKGAGPRMISFTLPAFGLVCATVLIGFACAFVIGRMTNTPVQAASPEPADLPATPIDNLQNSADVFDISPDPLTAATITPSTADTAAPTAAGVPNGALWGFQVIQYKLSDNGQALAETYISRLADKGFTEVYTLKKGDSIAVIVGADPSFRSLAKNWKDKLTAKGQRADPVKFNGADLQK